MADIFAGSIQEIASVSIDEPLQQSKVPHCIYYSTCYQRAAEVAKTSGNKAAVAVYQLLSAVCSFHPKFDDLAQPYGPMMQMAGRRSAVPDDLNESDLSALEEILSKTDDPSLKARILDVLWIKRKDHKACAKAVNYYIKSAQTLDAKDQWTYSVECYKRALQLASKLGYDKQLYKDAVASVYEAIRAANHGSTGFRTAQMMQMFRGFRGSEAYAQEFADMAKSIAETADQNSNPYLARAYWEIAAGWYALINNVAEVRTARIKTGECYVTEAEARIESDPNGALAAAVILRDGIEALRRAGADEGRIQALRKKLSVVQEESVKQMKVISTPVDISQLVEMAQKHVQDKDLQTTFLRFAFGRPLSNPEVVRKEVLKLANQFPLSHLMSASQVDDKGRVVAIKSSLLASESDQEAAIEAEIFSHVSKYSWNMRAVSFIEPARQQIENDHHPTLDDLATIVRNNPFIPPGHEEIFMRGIYAGFNGDYLISSHLLVPQIENSIRYVLETSGVDISNLLSDGTQPVKILGTLLGMPETKTIFGEELVFELRGLLIEKTGFDFRNRISHGFASAGECYSSAGINAWWIVLRLCLLPMYDVIKEKNKKDSQNIE